MVMPRPFEVSAALLACLAAALAVMMVVRIGADATSGQSLGEAMTQRPAPVAGSRSSLAAELRAAIPAVEAYRAEHGSYLGVTGAEARGFDPSLDAGIRAVGSAQRYCIDLVGETGAMHFSGPNGVGWGFATGRCPI